MAGKRSPEAPRAERIVPGIWRLRLPLPFPGVPHGNAWAVASDGVVVLFDTGIGGEGGMRRLDLALSQAGFALEDVRLVVCTHTHSDHYGLAAPITAAAGCELWLHPAWGHIRALADDPVAAFEERIEVARQCGVPAAALARYRESRRDEMKPIVDGAKPPDRELVDGVEVETDLGTWVVHETPGHAPSHVVFHQPERRLLISGDHLLGRTVLFFDQGHTPDPVGEFLASMDRVEPLDVGLVMAGHGRTFRDPGAKIAAVREAAAGFQEQVLAALADGGQPTPFEIVAAIVGPDNLETPVSGFVLQLVRAFLTHLAAEGRVEPVAGSDPQRWTVA